MITKDTTATNINKRSKFSFTKKNSILKPVTNIQNIFTALCAFSSTHLPVTIRTLLFSTLSGWLHSQKALRRIMSVQPCINEFGQHFSAKTKMVYKTMLMPQVFNFLTSFSDHYVVKSNVTSRVWA